MAVHRELGPGFLESVYKNAMLVELKSSGIAADLEKRLIVQYREQVVGEFFADLFVEDQLIVELKANAALARINEVQLVNYLKATHQPFGLLVNFGAPSLEFRRKFAERNNPENPVNPV